jgi:proteasome lid subunit RPN8/RPN11
MNIHLLSQRGDGYVNDGFMEERMSRRPRVPPEIMTDMIAHARQAYPAEACGIISGTQDALTRLTRCRNVQDEDPLNGSNSSREGYTVALEDLVAVLREGRARGEEIRAIYHSHVDKGAYFSDEDKRVATWGGKPVWPGVDYIVVSVMLGKPKEANLFTWNEGRRDFEGARLEMP